MGRYLHVALVVAWTLALWGASAADDSHPAAFTATLHDASPPHLPGHDGDGDGDGEAPTPSTDVDPLSHRAEELLREGLLLVSTGDADATVDGLQKLVQASGLQGRAAADAGCAAAALLEAGVPDVLEPDLAQAVKLYNRSAAAGNATAQFTMGVLHAHGLYGVPLDEGAAILHYYFAALGGNTPAQLALGHRHHTGTRVPKRCSTAVLYYELAANAAIDYMHSRGNVPPLVSLDALDDDAMEVLGDANSKNEQLVAYYQNLAEKGEPGVLIVLGQLLYYGARGVRQDFTAAAEHFLRAAEKGDAAAAANIGHMYTHGLGVTQDFEAAKAFLQMAADKGDAAGVNGLGYLHAMGYGFPRRHQPALKHFKRAAESGSSDASYNIGLMHLTSPNGKDFRQALASFTLAFNHNHLPATHKLAQMYLHGLGTAASCAKAVSLFQRVAHKGPWLNQAERAYLNLVNGNVAASVLDYLRLAEMGYIRAQANAAYLLDRVVSSTVAEDEALQVMLGVAALDGDASEPRAPAATPAIEANFAVEASVDAGGDVAVPGAGGEESPSDVPDTTPSEPVLTPPTPATPAPAANTSAASFKSVAQHRAYRLYKRAADQRDVPSLIKLGDYHWYGLGGLTPSDSRAAQYYRRAADEGRHPQAWYNLGYLHEHGRGLPQDYHLAKRYYDQAAEAHPKAFAPVAVANARMTAMKMWGEWTGDARADLWTRVKHAAWSLTVAPLGGAWRRAEAVFAAIGRPLKVDADSVGLVVLGFCWCSVLYIRAVRRAHVDTMHRRRLALLALQRHRRQP